MERATRFRNERPERTRPLIAQDVIGDRVSSSRPFAAPLGAEGRT